MESKELLYLFIGLLSCLSNRGSTSCVGRGPVDWEENKLTTDKNTNTLASNEFVLENEEKKWRFLIPYDEASLQTLSKGVRNAWEEAVTQLEQFTCLKIERSMDDESFIYFTNESGSCAARNIGRIEGKNIINFGPECDDSGIILRELMHVLGFENEHLRPNRDNYITIETRNNPQDDQMKPLSRTLYNLHFLPYDFYSVTHFDEREFSAHEVTASDKKGANFENRSDRCLSDLDKIKINLVYDCYGTYNPGKFTPKKCAYYDKEP